MAGGGVHGAGVGQVAGAGGVPNPSILGEGGRRGHAPLPHLLVGGVCPLFPPSPLVRSRPRGEKSAGGRAAQTVSKKGVRTSSPCPQDTVIVAAPSQAEAAEKRIDLDQPPGWGPNPVFLEGWVEISPPPHEENGRGLPPPPRGALGGGVFHPFQNSASRGALPPLGSF